MKMTNVAIKQIALDYARQLDIDARLADCRLKAPLPPYGQIKTQWEVFITTGGGRYLVLLERIGDEIVPQRLITL